MIQSLLNQSACRRMIVAFVVGSWMSSPSVVRGQDDSQRNDPVLRSWGKLKDVDYCSECHLQPRPSLSGAPDTSFSRQDETKFWIEYDKHCIARRRIEPLTKDELVNEAEQLHQQLRIERVPRDWFGASNVLSSRICEKLKYDVKTAAGYQKFRDNCLTCHGGYRGASDDANFSREGHAQPGISCNYCHQNDNHEMVEGDWSQQHANTRSDRWRLLPPEEKSKQGMRDLVTITTQASLCFDCHIGNLKQNKFVAHEMYAAGHPPLPSIEMETFCREMPQHWRSPSQLYKSLSQYEKRDQYFQINYPGLKQDPKEVFWNTRKMLIGMLTARKKALDMYIDSSSTDHWANYSLYDCAACHHELESTSQRQQRGFPGAPGRPRQAEWPIILFNRLAGEGELFKDLERGFTERLTDQPFGDPAEAVPVARELRERVTATLERIEITPVSSSTAQLLLRKLASTPSDDLLTYDAARTVVWAMQTIAKELREASQGSEDSEKMKALEALVMDLGDPAITGLKSELPSGRQQFIYADALATDLRLRANYSPSRLMTMLNRVSQMLAVARQDPSKFASQPADRR